MMQDPDNPTTTATDWWTTNAPTATAPQPVQTQGAPGFTPDPGHGTPVAPGSPPFATGPTPANYGGDPMNDAFIGQQIANYAAQHKNDPGFDQSLVTDPTYWINNIKQTGGWQGDNANYWTTKFSTAKQGGGSNGAPGMPSSLPVTPYGGIGSTPSPYVTPTWTGGSAPTAPTLTPFSAPTAAAFEASPGYTTMLDAGLRAGNMSAASRGTVLNGGTQKALARYGEDYANTGYNNYFGQSLATNQNNNNVTNTNFGNAFQTYTANYGQFTDAAARGLGGYQTNVTNARNAGNDYWTQLNDLYQTGANTANNSYKPGATA